MKKSYTIALLLPVCAVSSFVQDTSTLGADVLQNAMPRIQSHIQYLCSKPHRSPERSTSARVIAT